MTLIALIAFFAPLMGFVLTGLLARRISPFLASFITITFMVFAAIAGGVVFVQTCLYGHTFHLSLAPFLTLKGQALNWSLYLDALSGLMVGVVTSVSLMVHVYSVGYMKGEEGIPRFMAYLSLFTFLMLVLVTSSHLLQVFVGWEGVGVASYLLIGFYFKKESACAASMKAFLVNRVGDAGFIMGMALMLFKGGTLSLLDITSLTSLADESLTLPLLGSVPLLEAMCGFFFLGAMGKSAQLGLHVWLPDAMEGPTPVSALIHAATMVTAGVFLMVRLSPILECAPQMKTIILLIGALTALMAATIACVQTDIKRVIAYSTCSQLGYMFMAIGASAYGAAMFHLTTHAFFKALLFLGAGSVIHSFSGVQDMREMGGIWKKTPLTYAAMWIGNLALAGLPFFAGFYSKDAILISLYGANQPLSNMAFVVGLLGAFLTAFYSWRLLILVFHKEVRSPSTLVKAHIHESPFIMLGPLAFLGCGALFSGWLLNNLFLGTNTMWHGALPEMMHFAHPSLMIELLPVFLSLGGICLAFVLYETFPQIPQLLTFYTRPLYQFLLNQWYFDKIYHAILVKPLHSFSTFLWQFMDKKIIDNWCIHGPVHMISWASQKTSRLQTGFIQTYALWMLIGVFLFSLYLVWMYL